MRYLFTLTLLFTSFIGVTHAQPALNIGEQHSIHSKHLGGEDRNYYIHLPQDYDTSKASYPVLYVLDGQLHFPAAVAIQRSLGKSTELPKMIIVGIENTYPKRRDLVWRNKEAFISFLADELLPLIDQRYRTKQERVIFGWELGAYFSSHLLIDKSQLFDGAIASNGGLVDDAALQSFAARKADKSRYLYLANSIQDIYSIEHTNESVTHLNATSNENLIWKNESFNKETHSSLPYLAMFHGLKFFYHNYSKYEFYSIKQYEEFGGIPAISQYFKERAKRFGFPDSIDDSTKNKLIWLAWKRDNFEKFDFFMNEFSDVLLTKRYQSEYWQNRLGQYYLKNEKFDQALPFFLKATKEFKQTPRAYNGLGLVYLAKKDKQNAMASFNKAVELATEKSDKNLIHYQANLNKAKQS